MIASTRPRVLANPPILRQSCATFRQNNRWFGAISCKPSPWIAIDRKIMRCLQENARSLQCRSGARGRPVALPLFRAGYGSWRNRASSAATRPWSTRPPWGCRSACSSAWRWTSRWNTTSRFSRPAIAELPEVMECYLMTGDHDYLLRVVARDIEAFRRFLMDHLTRDSGGFQHPVELRAQSGQVSRGACRCPMRTGPESGWIAASSALSSGKPNHNSNLGTLA